MLEMLVGSKNAKKILLFLFVNSKCYGTQLQRAFKTALTPLQKTLMRLEQAGILTSSYEGNVRIYEFNPSYPLLEELQLLLKKAYMLLTSSEKKPYSFIKVEKRVSKKQKKEDLGSTLLNFWERLSLIKKLMVSARTKSHSEKGWNGKGNGNVIIDHQDQNVLIFHEKGSWQGQEGQDIGFSNVFRWTLNQEAGVIALEHLRRGMNDPVFLFHLAPSGTDSLVSIDSHLCGEDNYFGQVFADPHCLKLSWRVIGPKKNEEMDYYYI